MNGDTLDPSEDNIDERRLALEKEKAKHTCDIDYKRFALEETKAKREGDFLYRHSGTLITASVAFAAAIISLAGVASNWISKSYELKNTSKESQTKLELDRNDNAHKRFEANLERDRKWKLDALQFVAANRDAVFSGTDEDKRKIREIVLLAFPPEVSGILFSNLEGQAANERDKALWRTGQQQAEQQVAPAVSSVTTLPQSGGNAAQIEGLVKQLGSETRRQASDRLAAMYPQDTRGVVSSLIRSILPETDPRSYRHNLYVLVSLAKVPQGWEGTDEQVSAIQAFPKTQERNYKDPTFRSWADQASKSAKVIGK